MKESGPEWKCGKCGKTYNFEEFIKLENENYKSGRTPVCECGYRFLLDKWRLHDIVNVKIDEEEMNILVSTVDLELNHGWNKDLWYETMIFVEPAKTKEPTEDEEDKLEIKEDKKEYKHEIECNFQHRYETKEEAINDHNRVLNLIKEGKYKIEKENNERELILKE